MSDFVTKLVQELDKDAITYNKVIGMDVIDELLAKPSLNTVEWTHVLHSVKCVESASFGARWGGTAQGEQMRRLYYQAVEKWKNTQNKQLLMEDTGSI